MVQSSRTEFVTRSWAIPSPADTAEMIPVIINNCEYFLSREADVQVITEYEEQPGIWKAHAVHFTGTRRIAVATGSGKTHAEAIDSLHKATAQGVKRFNEVTGLLQTGDACAPPLTQKPSLYEQDFETKLEIDSEAKLTDIDDVISLPSDDEDSPVEQKSTVNWHVLSTACQISQDLQDEYAAELRDQLKRRDGNICTTPPPVPERLLGRKPSLKAVSLRTHAFPGLPSAAATPSDADKPIDAPTQSNAEPRLRRPARLSPPRSSTANEHGEVRSFHRHPPSRPENSQNGVWIGQGEMPHRPKPMRISEERPVILNVTWAGRRGMLRGSRNCRMHASILKDAACSMAFYGSDQFAGQSVPSPLDNSMRPYRISPDGHTNMIASIKTMRQGARQIAIPASAGDLSDMVSAQGMPEFDIEVLHVLPPPPPETR